MSGKAYTMREMKTIVEYLVEHKLYSEIRGRKMWMDFASTQLTTRTWQSLKETFLKRILPDIHNPYYKLTIEQISSFRVGYDVVDKNKQKLEIHTISDDSNSNGHIPKDNEQPNNGNSEEVEATAGENKKCSKIPQRSRSSADTVILENCYETAEDIQKDLESNGDKETDEQSVPVTKSLRDCITYSEPLTPMLQEVLDDFASEPEDSDREGQMQIVESVPENDNSEETNHIHEPKNEISNTKSAATDVAKNAKGLSAEVVEEVLAQELDGGIKSEKKSPKKKIEEKKTAPIEQETIINLDDEISSMQAQNGTEMDVDANAETKETTKFISAENTENSVAKDAENTEVSVANDSYSEPAAQSGCLNNSNNTVDASLPNNPEALKEKHSKNIEDKTNEATESVVEESNKSDQTQNPPKATRKRSCSQDTVKSIENKKTKLEIKLKPKSKKEMESNSEPLTDKMEIVSENVESKTAEEQPKADKQLSIIKKPHIEKKPSEQNKPSTSLSNEVEDKSDAEQQMNKNESAEIKNPCLENVSLFDEQFHKTKYNMSESSDTEQNKKETQETSVSKATVPKPVAPNDVVILKSHTDSDTEEIASPPKKKPRAGVLSSKSERDRAISNMFGFTSGGVGSKRRRQLSRRRRTISHNNAPQNNAAASHSSEWTSESDSDAFISPPRSRKNRPTRKYMKPHAAKILSLEEEGGLFVMYGKKIYPLIKDGKIIKNYLTYLPESDSEEGESYWKQKYVEEKKRAAELKKLLEQAKRPSSRETHSPILQANPLRGRKSSHRQLSESSSGVGKEICLQDPNEKKEEAKMNPPEKIKIKFTKNNEEVHLEGHWPQIHPVLEQVVQIFHKESEPTVSEKKSKMIVEHPENKESCSGISTPILITPVDPDVHEKVNKIETEIFKEIEERDKEDDNEPNGVENNVTERKVGRPRKAASSVPPSPMKQSNSTTTPETEASENNTSKRSSTETENKVTDKDNASKRPTRTTPRKVLNETVNTNDSKTIQKRRSKQKLDTPDKAIVEEDVRYMLPPKSTRLSLKSPANKKTKSQKSSAKIPKIFSSPDNLSLNSMDSTQGYQDSDVSPVKEFRKKKKLDTNSFVIKTRNALRRSSRKISHPYSYCDAYNDSSNSSVEKVVLRENSSLNTEAYRSESYELLMPRVKVSLTQLEPIDETHAIDNETYYLRNWESMRKNGLPVQINNNSSNSGQLTSDIGSSSNVSLPMSPELSVVENMSLSKDMLSNIEDFPTLNEMQMNDEIKDPTTCSKYMISDVDVSVPLMQQDCDLESCHTMTTDPKSAVTESLLSKITTFNINDQVTATDTLDQKLHDLLLESAKKMTATESAHNKESMMDVDVTNEVKVQKKGKTKKRCSTPRKRRTSQKSVAPKVDPVVEEEHVESCSQGGRKSCPPLLQTFVENVINEEIANLTIANEKPKGRKKKDIIKVKIQRPITKLRKSAQNASRVSVFTDSGINDTESETFLPINYSLDLIHNHSETCLHVNECVADSVEFLENSKSVITLGDSMQSGDNPWNSQSEGNDENISPDFFCNNAQDVSFYKKNNMEKSGDTSDTVYHSPLGTEVSHNSLITEDLSDEASPPLRSTKWYLLSEDETTHTNLVGQGSTMLSSGSQGSNLKQLFPITCAVPDLSTITEMSRENDDSRKPTLEIEGLTGDDFNSQSIF